MTDPIDPPKFTRLNKPRHSVSAFVMAGGLIGGGYTSFTGYSDGARNVAYLAGSFVAGALIAGLIALALVRFLNSRA